MSKTHDGKAQVEWEIYMEHPDFLHYDHLMWVSWMSRQTLFVMIPLDAPQLNECRVMPLYRYMFFLQTSKLTQTLSQMNSCNCYVSWGNGTFRVITSLLSVMNHQV
jgi:hypothetical protein